MVSGFFQSNFRRQGRGVSDWALRNDELNLRVLAQFEANELPLLLHLIRVGGFGPPNYRGVSPEWIVVEDCPELPLEQRIHKRVCATVNLVSSGLGTQREYADLPNVVIEQTR